MKAEIGKKLHPLKRKQNNYIISVTGDKFLFTSIQIVQYSAIPVQVNVTFLSFIEYGV